MQVAAHPDEGLLHNVLGVMIVAQLPAHVVQQERAITVGQLLKGER